MAQISKLQETDNKNRLKTIKYAATGALLGYGLKYAVPLSKFESKSVFNDEYVREAKNHVLAAKEKKIDNIIAGFKAKDAPSTEIQDVFIKHKKDILNDNFKTDNLKKGVKETIENYKKTISDVSKNAEKEFKNNKTLIAKGDRFTLYYMAMGAAILAGISIFMNFMNNSDKKS